MPFKVENHLARSAGNKYPARPCKTSPKEQALLCMFWLGRQDSNLRMTGPKPVALPLGDGLTCFYCIMT